MLVGLVVQFEAQEEIFVASGGMELESPVVLEGKSRRCRRDKGGSGELARAIIVRLRDLGQGSCVRRRYRILGREAENLPEDDDVVSVGFGEDLVAVEGNAYEIAS